MDRRTQFIDNYVAARCASWLKSLLDEGLGWSEIERFWVVEDAAHEGSRAWEAYCKDENFPKDYVCHADTGPR